MSIKLQNYVIFVGDIHGEWNALSHRVKKYNLSNCCLVLCGDVGIGFDTPKKTKAVLQYFNKFFSHKNIHVYAFRGNHDDPSYFTENSINQYSHIHLIPDYTILETDNDKILCIGGAISIDRYCRRPFISYWPNEAVVKNDDVLNQLSDITIVATHSSPTFVEPLIKNGLNEWVKYDKNIVEDASNDRKTLDDIYNILINNKNPLRKWYYGHYHSSKRENVFGIDFIMLNIYELSESF